MADNTPQMSGGSAPGTDDEPSLQRSTDAQNDVELKELGNTQETSADKAPAIPPKDADAGIGAATQTDEITEARRSPKGKEKADVPPAPIDRIDPLAIEPVGATPTAGTSASATADEPVCNITLLLTTGARHPYKIDEKYLSKRNVDVPDLTVDGKKDPFSISIYKLKELILREWRDEWEAKPASPTSIRLIHFGKLLEDKEQLKSMLFRIPCLTFHRTLKTPGPIAPGI
jgi:hypothetical protein